MLGQRGFLITDLYDLTFAELKVMLENINKGLAYSMWKQAVLNGAVFSKDFPKTPEEASPELYPEKTHYEMPDFLKEKAIKRGVY